MPTHSTGYVHLLQDLYGQTEVGHAYDQSYKQVHLIDYPNMVGQFVEYLKSKPFYDNTKIVIIGDHLTMGNDIFRKDADRTIYNVYIKKGT